MATPRKEQYSGCLIGQALGDALGFNVEGYAPDVSSRYVTQVIQAGKAAQYGRKPFRFGQYTDDTQLARELIQSYLSVKGFDPVDYAARINAIFSEGRIVGAGSTTKEAAQRLAEGVEWRKAGTPAPYAGNGSAMRAAPIGLFFWSSPTRLIAAAHDQGRITHHDSRSAAGSVTIAGAVSLALQSNRYETPIDPEAFLNQLSEWAMALSLSFAESLHRLKQWLALPPEDAAGPISQDGIVPGQENPNWQGISPFVVSSVLWSLYAFLRTPDDYMETICTAIGVGGDTDSTAAMAGAVSGAYLGIEHLPDDLAPMVNDRGTWGYMQLVNLADDLYDLVVGT